MRSYLFHNWSKRLSGIEACEPRYLLAGDVVTTSDLEVVADFSLIDVNPTSETYNQAVSPTDYRGQVSAWYFGFAT